MAEDLSPTIVELIATLDSISDRAKTGIRNIRFDPAVNGNYALTTIQHEAADAARWARARIEGKAA